MTTRTITHTAAPLTRTQPQSTDATDAAAVGQMVEDRPAIILHNLRRVLRDAERRGKTIQPRYLLDIIEGKKA